MRENISEIVKPAASLFLISLVAAICLGLVHGITLEPIKSRKAEDEINAVKEVFRELTDVSELTEAQGNVTKAFVCYSGNEVCGYAIFVTAAGYGGEIALLTGLEPDGKIRGVRIIEHRETPGLGSQAEDEGFIGQFANKSGKLILTKSKPSDNEIHAVTSATITSKAVTEGVNTAIDYYERFVR